jgi:nucleoside-diphosphate-sugar epimerase
VAAEDAAASVTRAGGVGIALRLGMLYGPDSEHTRDQLAAARRGRAGVLGDPDGFITQLHLDDAATAIVAALDAPPGLYNVGESDPLRRRELVAVWQDAVGRPLRTPPASLGRLGAARAVSRSVRVDSAAFHVATGWKPRHDNARTGLPAVLAAMDPTAT